MITIGLVLVVLTLASMAYLGTASADHVNNEVTITLTDEQNNRYTTFVLNETNSTTVDFGDDSVTVTYVDTVDGTPIMQYEYERAYGYSSQASSMLDLGLMMVVFLLNLVLLWFIIGLGR